ncbi:MAG: hypothetical protein ACFFD7_10335 [Candidatus Thorarchaeota archaeon]
MRHHLFKNDKKSIDPDRLALTINLLHNTFEAMDGNLATSLIDSMLDWSNDECPDYYKKAYPSNWKNLWQEVLNRRDFIKAHGVGQFLLIYYPDVVRRVFGHSVTNPNTIDNRIAMILTNWKSDQGSMPKLPNVILSKLGLTQTQITNFLGNP